MSLSAPVAVIHASRSPKFTAAMEIFGYLSLLAVATIAFVLGWLTPNGAAVVTVALLVYLLLLGWNRFHQGRHPCFLFLCTLTLLQGGRLLAYCLGDGDWPLRVAGMAPFAFDLTRNESGTVLLCLALSAICVYAPCRWNYRRVAPPDNRPVRRFLPYLYLLFYATLPIQLFKNYKYYEYLQAHGGYLYFWLNHSSVASSVPLVVRAIVLITYPVFVAIFVFERRRKYLYLTTILYFGTASLVLLMGSRASVFALILSLWYVAAVKSNRRSRVLVMVALVLGMVLVADVVQSLREDSDALATYSFAPLEFVRLQGNSLDVTEVAVKYRSLFAPHAASYLWNELQDAFVARDSYDYARGRLLGYDVPVLLNPAAFANGMGTAGSYLAEAYIIGGLAGVAIISLLLGSFFHLLYRLSGSAGWLLVVAMVLPDLVIMPRGTLLDWASALMRNALSFALIGAGWILYRFVLWLMQQPKPGQSLAAHPAGAAS